MAYQPMIQRLDWVDIRQVLPNEATDFTPWLAENLELLADALGLEGLELIDREAPVQEFRLDIRAVGEDTAGTTYAVAIENQYGQTDHDHLGKLITYTAHAYDDPDTDQTLAIWVTEAIRDAHVAAIDFLNRTSPDTVGYVLVSPRFVEGANGYLVHFEVHTEPNAFLRSGKNAPSAVPAERTRFMTAVHEATRDRVLGFGYRGSWMEPDGWLIRFYLPTTHPLSSWAEIRVRVTKTRFRVAIQLENGDASAEESRAILETIRARHGEALEAIGEIDWESPGAPEIARRAWARLEIHGLGYESGDSVEAAAIVERFAETFLVATRDDDPALYPEPAGELLPKADTETVIKLVSLVQPGEWTTYGDLSEAIRGNSGAAMAIGSIIAANPDVPHPHRVLNAGGSVPSKWRSDDGKGPEECIRLLAEDGVTVASGIADTDCHVSAEELVRRMEQAAI